jgi:hypothetical protein
MKGSEQTKSKNIKNMEKQRVDPVAKSSNWLDSNHPLARQRVNNDIRRIEKEKDRMDLCQGSGLCLKRYMVLLQSVAIETLYPLSIQPLCLAERGVELCMFHIHN